MRCWRFYDKEMKWQNVREIYSQSNNILTIKQKQEHSEAEIFPEII